MLGIKATLFSLDVPEYQEAAILDDELSVHVCAHILACTESNDSYVFGLNAMTSFVSELHTITEVTFSDRLASVRTHFLNECENPFFKCFQSLQDAVLCNWHLRVKNLGDEWVNYHPNKAEAWIISPFF